MNAIDPQVDPMEEDEIFDTLNDQQIQKLQEMILEQKQKIPDIFQKQLNKIKKFKESTEFVHIKKQIHHYSTLPMWTSGTEIIWIWKYVKWTSTSNCNSRIPCYKQYAYTNYADAQWQECYSGCSPVAAAMIFWYHDRNGKPNLFPGIIAPMINTSGSWWWQDTTMRNAINEIRGYMNTECVVNSENPNWSRAGSTYESNIRYAIQFAKNHWYPQSQRWWVTSDITYRIKNEIDNGRPILISIQYQNGEEWWGHSIVGYGYQWYEDQWWHPLWLPVRINAGWWNGMNSNTNINLYFITNLQYNNSDDTIKVASTVTYYHVQ